VAYSEDTVSADNTVRHLRFDNRVAVVTEAGSGLGQRYALFLAERGARVVVNDARGDDAERVAQQIGDRGGTALANGDLVDTPEGGHALIDAALQRFGVVDIVVHQTARPSDAGSSQAMLTDADPVGLLGGLAGGFWLTHAAWAHMRGRRNGRIVLTSGLDRSIGDAMEEGNAVAAMGLVGLMNILKVEGRNYDVKVNMVVATGTADPAARSDLVAYLAHEACGPTGEIFTVTKGGLARMFVGVNTGYFDPELRMEDVRDRLGDILSPDTMIVPDDASEEIALLMNDLNSK
jgi:NAD(P)-dependent dehydrogenase (short-subunit alcohol dehydrogenase family)